MAGFAPEPVDTRFARDRLEAGPSSASDPAIGALEMSPYERTKMVKAINRRVRTFKRRLRLRQFYLRLCYFFSKVRYALLYRLNYVLSTKN